MDKLRQSYTKYQSQIFAQNPRYIAPQKVQKYAKMADNQIKQMEITNQFTNYQQALFYKEKFDRLHQIALKLNRNQISSSAYHKQVKEALKKDFKGTIYGNGKSKNVTINQSYNEIVQQPIRSSSKSPLKDFFDEQQIKNSKKVTFNSILHSNDVPLKYGLKSVSRSKSKVSHLENKDNFELKRLQDENRKLRNKIQQSKINNGEDINNERIRQLRNQVRQLDEQNQRLKSEVSRSVKSQVYLQTQYEPYNLKVRQNNILKINSKNLSMSQKNSQFGSPSQFFYKSKHGSQVYFDRQADFMREDIGYNTGRQVHQNYQMKKEFPVDNDLLNSSVSTIQTQFLNLQNSQLYDEDKNQICREKIAFFKKSMIIVKQNDYDIAFKRSDFNTQMDKLRLILYINNKSQKKFDCSIQYEYDREDYDIIVRKRIGLVQGRRQGRQQIQIHLKNPSDLGSLISAKLRIGDQSKKIIVPALFIDFDSEYKYKFQNIGYIQRNITAPLTIRPMSQFANIDVANNILDLNREYQQIYAIGKLYGKSKVCKGVVKLSWKSGNKLKIQTCEEWRTLMGYLFLNADQTIHY